MTIKGVSVSVTHREWQLYSANESEAWIIRLSNHTLSTSSRWTRNDRLSNMNVIMSSQSIGKNDRSEMAEVNLLRRLSLEQLISSIVFPSARLSRSETSQFLIRLTRREVFSIDCALSVVVVEEINHPRSLGLRVNRCYDVESICFLSFSIT